MRYYKLSLDGTIQNMLKKQSKLKNLLRNQQLILRIFIMDAILFRVSHAPDIA